MQEIENSKEIQFDFRRFEELLKDVCTIDPKIKNVLHTFQGKTAPSNIDCEFYLIKSTEQKVREEDFIKVLLGTIVRFTLSYIKRHPVSKNSTADDIMAFYEQNMVYLVHEAKGLFIEKLSKSTSEFGELFLFMLLESKGIVQLLNKMNLKTNGDMPVHGLDAIHIGVNGNSLVFYYGYSKVYENHTDAIRDAVKEIKNFSNDLKRQDREYDLVNDYIDRDKFKGFSDQIVDIISPYASNKSFVAEAHSIFLGYHWPLLEDPQCPSSMKLDPYLIGEYLKTLEPMEASIRDHIYALPDASKQSFIVWTLPLSDLQKFRAKFMDRLKSI